MNTIQFSDSIGSISKALVALRAKLKPLVKGSTNPHYGDYDTLAQAKRAIDRFNLTNG